MPGYDKFKLHILNQKIVFLRDNYISFIEDYFSLLVGYGKYFLIH